MRLVLKMAVQEDADSSPAEIELATFAREPGVGRGLGLTLQEAKALLAASQQALVGLDWQRLVDRSARCEGCGSPLRRKDVQRIVYRTAFGKVDLQSPRYRRCQCSSASGSFSPVSGLLHERTHPELVYLQTKWAAFVSYRATLELLSDVLP
jgi:hypothetical protein